jgi:hypothetical protein
MKKAFEVKGEALKEQEYADWDMLVDLRRV